MRRGRKQKQILRYAALRPHRGGTCHPESAAADEGSALDFCAGRKEPAR